MTTAQEPLAGPTLSPPCSAEDSTNNFNRTRCQFVYSDGRRCRNERASRCLHHSSQRCSSGDTVAPEAALEALPELQALCSDLSTATNINRALAHTYLLMAQKRISRKDAVAFGYLTQLLLQTVPGVRAEYVAVHGYRAWEESLKSAFDSAPAAAPPETPASPSESAPDRRKISPDRAAADEPPSSDPAAEYFQDVYERSLDLFAGKYDATPEGRAEAQKLALELELMKSPDSEPPKGRLGEVVSLVRRVHAQQQKAARKLSKPAAPPPVTAVNMPLPNREAASPKPPVANAAPTKPDTGLSVPSSTFAAAPDPPRASPSAYPLAAADFASITPPAAPSGRIRRKRSARSAPPPFEDRPFSELDYFDAPPKEQNSPKGEGHTTDWYVPPSWSNNRPPDPFPSRREKLAQKFRAMSSAAFRRRQHRMQNQTFWEQPR